LRFFRSVASRLSAILRRACCTAHCASSWFRRATVAWPRVLNEAFIISRRALRLRIGGPGRASMRPRYRKAQAPRIIFGRISPPYRLIAGGVERAPSASSRGTLSARLTHRKRTPVREAHLTDALPHSAIGMDLSSPSETRYPGQVPNAALRIFALVIFGRFCNRGSAFLPRRGR